MMTACKKIPPKYFDEGPAWCETHNAPFPYGDDGKRCFSALIDKARTSRPAKDSVLCAKIRELTDENAKLENALIDVDGLIEEYGIDTIGTGSAPSQKEQARVDAIVEAAITRVENRRKEG